MIEILPVGIFDLVKRQYKDKHGNLYSMDIPEVFILYKLVKEMEKRKNEKKQAEAGRE